MWGVSSGSQYILQGEYILKVYIIGNELYFCFFTLRLSLYINFPLLSLRIICLRLSLPFYFYVLVSVSFSVFIPVFCLSSFFPISFFPVSFSLFYQYSPDTSFPMNSLDGYDVSFFGVSMCSHIMMNTLNILNRLPVVALWRNMLALIILGNILC